ncbi:L,D-transpeptidase family protein [Brevifollis gellanilyticus]|uniref:L,D-transpeptidase family protein n=1 Tax=Brevifollis gellanilyticus TaxID=748831 RepID=UPI0011BF894F|nr:L,D-transpeptidase family protein [Brevifollis gellanilyticus]
MTFFHFHCLQTGSALGAIQTSLAAILVISLFALTGCATRPVSEPQADPTARNKTVQLQIFLDGRNFGPGVVDGHEGEFTRKALALYQQSQNMPSNVVPDVSSITPYTDYAVTADDLGRLGTMAVEPVDQAQQKSLPYTRLSELLAERFHTTVAFVTELNAGRSVDALTAEEVIRVPNIQRPFRVVNYPSGYARPPASVVETRRVLVDTRLRMLRVTDGSRLLAAFPLTPGSQEHPAPLGEWKITGAVPWPWYRYDEGVLKRGVRTETFYNLPPGPNSPVGVLWTGLNRPGVGIHGTSFPETIGRAGSHGCIRLSNWDAATFYTLVQKGMAVTIQ